MSSMNFPSSPSDGDVYRKWQYDAATSSWTLHGVSGVTGDLGVLTINGQTFDPMADSDLSVTVSGSGSLGVLSINGQAFDPAADSDLSLTVSAGDIGVSYGSTAPVTNGTNEGEEFFVTSDGTSSGVVSEAYIWNGSTWTAAQSTTLDGSVSGSDF
jgi:hypothetical protein